VVFDTVQPGVLMRCIAAEDEDAFQWVRRHATSRLAVDADSLVAIPVGTWLHQLDASLLAFAAEFVAAGWLDARQLKAMDPECLMQVLVISGMTDEQRVLVLQALQLFPTNDLLSEFLNGYPLAAMSLQPAPLKAPFPPDDTELWIWLSEIRPALGQFADKIKAEGLLSPREILNAPPEKLVAAFDKAGMDVLQSTVLMQVCRLFDTNWELVTFIKTDPELVVKQLVSEQLRKER